MRRVTVLHNVIDPTSPSEQDTINAVESVSGALREIGYEVQHCEFTLNLRESCAKLLSSKPDFVFNMVEGVDNANELSPLAPMILDTLHIPYTGCPSSALFITTDKTLTKRLLQASGIPTPSWISRDEEICPLEGELYLLKPSREDASVGIHEDDLGLVRGLDAVRNEIKKREKETAYLWFAEQYIDGREFNISVFTSRDLKAGKRHVEVLPPAEIKFVDYPEEKYKIVGYKAKWEESSFEFTNTPRTFSFPESDKALLAELTALTYRCAELFSLTGYARVDYRVDKNGKPWVLEINANPGIEPSSGFVAATANIGLSYREAIRIISENLQGAI